ncbi:Methyltransferase domain containing protein [uncultured Caudovirales phage]|uniref:Methyltransferase domain containing protein n=1 Tax=uncultured Caudovirales phage TaxID=2100421 RepID=A0A6J5LCF2_9CAUD|nr:Methyltransferase domain containing protein [uncultured Caudovirales phage]CAB4135175.1 Methyltransferase domain containing protein [uncultured Caudovirales phage]
MSTAPAFVIASRKTEDATQLSTQLQGHPQCILTMPSIFEAYEAGRECFQGRTNKIVYLHDDVIILDLEQFLNAINGLERPGLYGVIGGANPETLEHGWWWEKDPWYGAVVQGGKEDSPSIFASSYAATPVSWLDGLCLITVDQQWSWTLPGNPTRLWHGYDLFASKMTAKSGGAVEVISQPENSPLLQHNGFGRMDGANDGISIVRALTRTLEERRDFPNISQHIPRLRDEAHGIILELGCREGVSTGALLEGLDSKGEGFLLSVDIDDCSQIWKGHPRWKFFHGESTNVAGIINALNEAGIPPIVSVLFIDSEHTYNLCSQELRTWYPYMKPNGTIILHDTEEFPEVYKAIEDFIAETGNITHEFIRGCNGLSVLKLSISSTG